MENKIKFGGKQKMAEPDITRNTDVPSTIAGFYFQILIACYEICRRDVEEVGIETGADIVVIDNKKESYYIETKLHVQKKSIEYKTKIDNYSDNIESLNNEKIKINSGMSQSESMKKTVFLTELMIQKYEAEKGDFEKIVSEAQRYGIHIEPDYPSTNVRRLLKNSMIYQKWLATEHAALEEKKGGALNAISKLCETQKEMLLKVQEFVNEQVSIENCPVCKGITFFKKGENAKDKFLSIVNDSIADGNLWMK